MLLGDLLGSGAPPVAALLLAALAVDALFGEMGPLFRRLPHPVVSIGSTIAALERRWNDPAGDAAPLRRRGALTVLILVALSAALGAGLGALARVTDWLWPLEVFVVAVLLAQRSLYDHVRAVADGLERGGLPAGRDAVRHIVGRDPASLDEAGVGRAAVESLAENFSDGVVAPALWYLLLGLPGILVYKTVNTLDSMIGHKTVRYQHFGMVAARMDDVMNLAPARLSGLLIAIAAAFVPKVRPAAALQSMLREAGKHRSPNAGWPESAMAGALHLKLAGPRRYPGEVVDAPFIGPGTSEVTAGHIRQALVLYAASCGAMAALVLAIWVLY